MQFWIWVCFWPICTPLVYKSNNWNEGDCIHDFPIKASLLLSVLTCALRQVDSRRSAVEFTRTIKWLIWVMHVPSNLWRHAMQLWAPQLSAGQIETLCLQSKDEKEKKPNKNEQYSRKFTWNQLQQWLRGIENSPLIRISWNNDCSYDGQLKPRGQIKGNAICFYIVRWIVQLFTIVSVIKDCICSGRYVVSAAHWHSNPGLFPWLQQTKTRSSRRTIWELA